MSQSVKEVETSLQSNITLGQVRKHSVEELGRPTSLEAQPIITSQVSSFPKLDKAPGVTVTRHQVLEKLETETGDKEIAGQNPFVLPSLADENKEPENVCVKNFLDFRKSSCQSFSDEPVKQEIAMDFRNNFAVTKKLSDFERKKLEAELKATEEIAKIKQSVIEKRLALELASLRETATYQQQTRASSTQAQAELRALEDVAQKKQALIEQKLVQDLDAIEFQSSRPLPPLPTQKLPPPLPKPENFMTEPVYSNAMQTPSDYMNIAPPVQEYRKVAALGIRTSQHADRRDLGSVTGPSVDPRFTRIPSSRYMSQMRDRMEYSDQGQPGLVPIMPSRNRSVWRSMISKVKGKLKHQRHPPWD